MNLTEIYRNCQAMAELSTHEQEVAFLVRAKKENPNVTLDECMQVAGYKSGDQKEQNNLKQKFRNNVLLPLKIYLGKKLFNLTHEQSESIWTHKPLVDNHEEIKAAINSKLPSSKRTSAPKEKNFAFLNDLI